MPTAFQGSKCVRGGLKRSEYQVRARYQIRANALLHDNGRRLRKHDERAARWSEGANCLQGRRDLQGLRVGKVASAGAYIYMCVCVCV